MCHVALLQCFKRGIFYPVLWKCMLLCLMFFINWNKIKAALAAYFNCNLLATRWPHILWGQLRTESGFRSENGNGIVITFKNINKLRNAGHIYSSHSLKLRGLMENWPWKVCNSCCRASSRLLHSLPMEKGMCWKDGWSVIWIFASTLSFFSHSVQTSRVSEWARKRAVGLSQLSQSESLLMKSRRLHPI